MNEPGEFVELELQRRFERLLRDYGRLIRSVVWKVAGARAPDLGADVEQRILTELWKRHGRREVMQHPSSYLYRCAVRETVRALKQETRAAEDGLDRDPRGPRVEDPHVRLERRELGQILRSEIRSLSPERARAVRFHLAGFEVKEIMKFEGWSYQKARNLIARGMDELRRRLRERGIDG